MASSASSKQVSALGRSVVDFVTQDELEQALSTVTRQGIADNDWVLPVPDPEAEEQTAEGEMQRLLTLKSYQLLDADKEEQFDALTREACQVFGVPTSLISLIDLGRQFLLSNTGVPGDVRETTRDVAFCSHTILNKNGIVVVNDTKEDNRFMDNPLVTQEPKLRFYAGAPLISPEGYKLGTFCVEGPEPRPDGLSDGEKQKLKDYAATAMKLMVERRKNLRDRLANSALDDDLRRHAAVTTNLGDLLYASGHPATAMGLYQESVQTLMFLEEEQGANSKPPKERQETLAQLLKMLSDESIPSATREELLEKVSALQVQPKSDDAGSLSSKKREIEAEGITGLFYGGSKVKGVGKPRPLPGLIFGEAFQIDMGDAEIPLVDKPFFVSTEECSKATLYNMGLIHYHWNKSPELALQFFHLAASVSVKLSKDPLGFDPVDLACVNNMAQIHLQYRHADEALKMLTEALDKGNKTLAQMYCKMNVVVDVPETDSDDDDEACAEAEAQLAEEYAKMKAAGEEAPAPEEAKTAEPTGMPTTTEEEAARLTKRFRRKLARTVMNIGHVHYYSCDYDSAMLTCQEALGLLDEDSSDDKERAAIWHNMSVLLDCLGKKHEALTYLEKYISLARELEGPQHIQVGDGLYRKGHLLYETGQFDLSLAPLQEATQIRQAHFGTSLQVAECKLSLGKLHLAKKEDDAAVQVLQQCLDAERQIMADSTKDGATPAPSFDMAQTLLEIGRAYHAKGDLAKALEAYLEAAELARQFFGPKHFFVGRIVTIVGNLYTEIGDAEKAKPFLNEAAEILQVSKP